MGCLRNLLVCAVSVAACTTLQPGSENRSSRFEIGVMGDQQYTTEDEAKFRNLMDDVNRSDLVFVVHVGDIEGDYRGYQEGDGMPPCTDETFLNRLELFNASRHPFILTPGDNEWTDCHASKTRKFDPLERLAKVRELFFQGDQSLGQRKLLLTRQSNDPKHAKFRENAYWVYSDILFVTIHIPGSNNNFGRTSEMDKEYAERNAANIVWLKETFGLARSNGYKGILIFTQANLNFEDRWPERSKRSLRVGPSTQKISGFMDFLVALESETVAFGRPVALVHGDTHYFRVDKPLFDSKAQAAASSSARGRTIDNFTRVETFGTPSAHWVRVFVDPNDPSVFTFKDALVAKNLHEVR
jgi:hypothetical protein